MYWIGYIGAFFLICRLIPITYEQIQTKGQTPINLLFLFLEGCASLFLGISSISYKMIPFIIANSCSLLNIFLIIFIQLYFKKKDNNNINENIV